MYTIKTALLLVYAFIFCSCELFNLFDTEAPAAVDITAIEASSNGQVLVRWEESASEDISLYRLEGDWGDSFTLPWYVTEHQIDIPRYERLYSMSVIAIDRADNESTATTVHFLLYRQPSRIIERNTQYPALDNVWKFDYNDQRELASSKVYFYYTDEIWDQTYSYKDGMLSSAFSVGNSIVFDYQYGSGKLIEEIINHSKDGFFEITYTYNDDGQLLERRETQNNQLASKTTYDGINTFNQVEAVTYKDFTDVENNATISIEYQDGTALCSKVEYRKNREVLFTAHLDYDSNMLKTKETYYDAAGNQTGDYVVSRTDNGLTDRIQEYDTNGNIVMEWEYTYFDRDCVEVIEYAEMPFMPALCRLSVNEMGSDTNSILLPKKQSTIMVYNGWYSAYATVYTMWVLDQL